MSTDLTVFARSRYPALSVSASGELGATQAHLLGRVHGNLTALAITRELATAHVMAAAEEQRSIRDGVAAFREVERDRAYTTRYLADVEQAIAREGNRTAIRVAEEETRRLCVIRDTSFGTEQIRFAATAVRSGKSGGVISTGSVTTRFQTW